MFNFDLLNEAVFDFELTDKEFRLLYVIANNAAMNNTNTVQLHNGWLMDKLNCCERQIRRLTNGLNEKGYLIKSVSGTSKNKNANTYTLERTLQADKNVPLKTSVNILKIEDNPINNTINVDKNVDKNVPPKNNIKIKENNNNLSTIELKDLGPKVTEYKKEKVNEMKNAVLSEMEREIKSNNNITSTSGEKNTNFNEKEPMYGNLTDDLFDEIFGLSSTEADVNVTGDKVEHSSTETSNKAAGDVKTASMEQLPTNEDKNAPEGLKTQNNAYSLQEWMAKYNKLISNVENTDVEDGHFDTLLEEGVKLIEAFPKNEGNYQRAMQDLRYWVAKNIDFKKSYKISEHWNKYYRAA